MSAPLVMAIPSSVIWRASSEATIERTPDNSFRAGVITIDVTDPPHEWREMFRWRDQALPRASL